MRGKLGRGKNEVQPKPVRVPDLAPKSGVSGAAFRFGLIVFAVSLASGFIAGVSIKKAAKARVVAGHNEMRTILVSQLAKSISPAKLNKIWKPKDKAGAPFQLTYKAFRAYLSHDPRLADAYAYRFVNGKALYVIDAGNIKKSSDGRTILRADVGEEVRQPSTELIQAFKSKQPILETQPLLRPEGDVVRAYAPLLSATGKIVGVVGLDVLYAPMARDLEDLDAAFRTGLLGAFGFSFFLGLVSGWIVRRLRATMSAQSSALGMTQENLTATLAEVNELNNSLVKTLNSAGCLIWTGTAKQIEGKLVWTGVLKHQSPFGWVDHHIANGEAFDEIWDSLRDPEDQHLWERTVRDAMTKHAESASSEYRICRENGESYWFAEQLSFEYLPDGRVVMEAFVSDISETRERGEEVRRLAFFDSVTGLINRTKIHEVLGVLLSENPRVSVIGIEISNFRNINESWGAEIGDKLLKAFGQTLAEGVGGSGIVGRLAGDDFVVIVPDFHAMSWLVGKIDELCQKPIYVDGVEIMKTCRIGYVTAEEAETATGILRKVNLALENARKNQSIYPVTYKPEMSFRAKMRVELETAMRQALNDGEFHLMFQPIYDNRSKKLVKAEALLRWNSSRFGQVSPATFIPIAEESDIINDLGNYVLDETAKAIRKLIDTTGNQAFAISMNLSLRQLKNNATLNAFSTAVDRWGITPKNLIIEVTESSIMHDAGECHAMLNQLQDRGFSLAIDDFGTGYSSLATLASLPFDILKIDKRFVDGIAIDRKQEEVLATIIRLARALNLQIVAEGIEKVEQFEFLRAKEVEYSQGYYFSRPLGIEDFVLLSTDGNDLAA